MVEYAQKARTRTVVIVVLTMVEIDVNMVNSYFQIPFFGGHQSFLYDHWYDLSGRSVSRVVVSVWGGEVLSRLVSVLGVYVQRVVFVQRVVSVHLVFVQVGSMSKVVLYPAKSLSRDESLSRRSLYGDPRNIHLVTVTAAVGTHPTGMHSCLHGCFVLMDDQIIVM